MNFRQYLGVICAKNLRESVISRTPWGPHICKPKAYERTRFPKSNSFSPNKKSSYDDLNHYIQRRPQQAHQYDDGNKDDYDYDSYYDKFRSYGARVPKRDYFDEADYHDYHRNNYRELNHYRKERQTSVLDNIRENLPWPLSMVGRIGENDET